ncbi:hypothetical protein [Streptomyces prasinus]
MTSKDKGGKVAKKVGQGGLNLPVDIRPRTGDVRSRAAAAREAAGGAVAAGREV